MTRALLFLGAISVVLAACPARRDGLSRDALERSLQRGSDREALPEVADLLRWRVPQVPPVPAVVVGRAAEQALLRGDEIPAADDDAELLRCLRADAQRDYAAIVKHCAATISTRPDDLRSAIVAGLLRRHLSALNNDDATRVATAATSAVAACGARPGAQCAWLAAATMRLVAAASAQVDATESDDDSLRSIVADGPFTAVHFRESGSEAERVAHPRRATRLVTARGPRLHPAEHGGRGWYRLQSESMVSASGTAHLFVTGGGALQVLVDGAVVHTRPNARFSADIEWVPLDLEAGRHRLEVLAYDDGDGLSVAVLNDAGRSIWRAENVTTQPTAPSKRRSDRGWSTALLLPAAVEPGDAPAFVTLTLRHHAARAGLGSDDELAALTTTMLGAFGWSPVAAILAAQAVEADGLPERFAAGLTAPLWAAAHARWPTSPLPLLAQARATKAETPDAALTAYRTLVAAAPNYPQGRRELLPLLLEQGLVDEANAVATALLAVGHTTENIEAAVPALRAAGRLREAAALVEERAARAPDYRWRHLLRKGETDAAHDALASLVDVDDETGREALEAITELDEVVQPDRALARLQPQLADVPAAQQERLRLQMAKILASTAGDADALKALPATTTSLDALGLAAALGAQPPWASHLVEGDRVVAERRRATAPFAQWPLVFLHTANEHHYAEDGSALVIRHWLVEVRTKQAIDSIGELKKDDGELLVRLRVHKPDGSTVEPEHHRNIDAISLTGLAPGDVVEWLSVNVDRNGVGGGALQQQQLPSYAAAAWRLVVSVPEALVQSRRFRIDSFNGAPPAKTATADGRTTTTFAATMLPARRPEPLAVDADEEQPTIVVSLDFDDAITRRLRAPALAAHATVDTWMRRVAQHVAQRGSDDDKLQRLFRFVAEQITEAEGADAIATLAVGRGRRLPLLLALLRAAEVRTTPVALHSSFDGPRDRPTVGAFPTLAIVVETPTPHVVATLGDALVLDRLPATFAAASTLNLETGARGVVPDSAIDPDGVDVRIDVALADNATKLTGLVAVKVPTIIADQLRGGIRQATPEQLAHFIEAGLAASMPGVVASNVATPDLDAVAQPLTFVADIAVDVDPNTVRFEHMFSQGAAAAFRAAFPLGLLVQVAERETTLRARPQRERLEVTVRLPPSASFVDVPPTTKLVAGPVTLDQRAAVTDGVLVWERSLDVTAAAVPPSAWPEVRAALAPLLAGADARLGFVRAQPAGGVSR